jgi:hypothetical protein
LTHKSKSEQELLLEYLDIVSRRDICDTLQAGNETSAKQEDEEKEAAEKKIYNRQVLHSILQ